MIFDQTDYFCKQKNKELTVVMCIIKAIAFIKMFISLAYSKININVT